MARPMEYSGRLAGDAFFFPATLALPMSYK